MHLTGEELHAGSVISLKRAIVILSPSALQLHWPPSTCRYVNGGQGWYDTPNAQCPAGNWPLSKSPGLSRELNLASQRGWAAFYGPILREQSDEGPVNWWDCVYLSPSVCLWSLSLLCSKSAQRMKHMVTHIEGVHLVYEFMRTHISITSPFYV